MAKKKKPVSELDESIIRELKKNRVFSKIQTKEYTEEIDLDYFIKSIDEMLVKMSTEYELARVYILDKIYTEADINFLITTEDSYTFVINDNDIFNRLQDDVLTIPSNVELLFYDENTEIVLIEK